MNILNDTRLLHQLNSLRNEYSSAYLNLKRNISAAYQMYYVQKAEREFNSKTIECFKWYQVDETSKERFANYCGVSSGESIYYLIKNTEDFSMIFVAGKNSLIIDKKSFFDEDTVFDILFTFELQLMLCEPEDIY